MRLTLAIFVAVLVLLSAQFSWAACDDNLPAGARNDVLVIVNDNAVDSCEVGRYYAQQRQLGKENILHVKVPPTYYVNQTDFEKFRDQVIRHITQKIYQQTGLSISCSGGRSPYYCEQAVQLIRQHSSYKTIVTTMGMPALVVVPPGAGGSSGEPASLDGYLLASLSSYSADGRLTTIVDGKLGLGRVDGLTLDAAKKLIDRAIKVEKEGFFGNFVGIAGAGGRWAPDQYSSSLDSSNQSLASHLFTGATDDRWRYFLGIFDESRPDCTGNRAEPFYLSYARDVVAGRAPSNCKAKFVKGSTDPYSSYTEPVPGRPSSRIQQLANVGVFMANMDGQATYSYDPFETIFNWKKPLGLVNQNALCQSGDQACTDASEDALKEIDTRYIGVAEGFIGFHMRSYPLTYMASWPSKWQPVGAAGGPTAFKALPQLDNSDGKDDSHSLVFSSHQAKANPSCYASDALDDALLGSCYERLFLAFSQPISYGNVGRDLTVAPAPQATTIKVGLWYKSKQGSGGLKNPLTATLTTTITVAGVASQQTLGSAYLKNTDLQNIVLGENQPAWTYASADIPLDLSKLQQVGGKVNLASLTLVFSSTFSGEMKVDAISLVDDDGNPLGLQNASFADGNKQFGVGDWAATFTSRLNGAAFWGSVTHNDGGTAFQQEVSSSVVSFFRGTPLGTAVWGDTPNSGGQLIADPLYSPVAVSFDRATLQTYYPIDSAITLSGSVRNGTDAQMVSTTYSVDYCLGDDFYSCDRENHWLPTGIQGSGGADHVVTLGSFTLPSATAVSSIVFRLNVTSEKNDGSGEFVVLHDFINVQVIHFQSDDDGDGLIGSVEIAAGTNPREPDSDGDEFPDGWEVQHGYNPLLADYGAMDSDGDGLSDKRELYVGSSLNSIDTDGDGYTDYVEVYSGEGLVLDAGLNPDFGIKPIPLYAGVGHKYRVELQKNGDFAPSFVAEADLAYATQPIVFNASLTGDVFEWTPTQAQAGWQNIYIGPWEYVSWFRVKVIPLDGDINEDGVFNLADLALLQKIVLGQMVPTPAQIFHADYYPLSEPNGVPDDKLDMSDLLIMQKKLISAGQ